MCRQTVSKKVASRCEDEKAWLKSKMAQVSWVSVTVDLWSSPNSRGYLGMTIHWLDSTTLEREGAVLCIRRLKGTHTHIVLAKAMSDIFHEFNIDGGKVVRLTCDNGSNFRAAMRVFGVTGEQPKPDKATAGDYQSVILHDIDLVLALSAAHMAVANMQPHVSMTRTLPTSSRASVDRRSSSNLLSPSEHRHRQELHIDVEDDVVSRSGSIWAGDDDDSVKDADYVPSSNDDDEDGEPAKPKRPKFTEPKSKKGKTPAPKGKLSTIVVQPKKLKRQPPLPEDLQLSQQELVDPFVDEEGNGDDLQQVELFEILSKRLVPGSQEDEEDTDTTQLSAAPELPPHSQCAAHAFNLVAAVDVEECLRQLCLQPVEEAFRGHKFASAMDKLRQIWSKKRSTPAQDRIVTAVHKKIAYPSPTRWNSRYDCLKTFSKLERKYPAEMETLFVELKIKDGPMDTNELAALDDYVTVSAMQSLCFKHGL
jgi:hypothetical protein